jgi:2-isopropylmalate synthase
VIEAGFPASSEREAASVSLIARATLDMPGRPAPAAFARARTEDVQKAIIALASHPKGIVHITLPSSDRHIRTKLGVSRAEVLNMAREAMRRVIDAGFAVEIGAEDATRADRSFLADLAAFSAENGATAFNIADTLGLAIPESIASLVSYVSRAHPAYRDGKAFLSAHCHNDSGLALANTLAAIRSGATQVEVTALGLGERTGNAALEELAFVLASREENYPVDCRLDPEKARDAALVVAAVAGTDLSPLKPITGTNVHAHASGIHQQGLSRDRGTYAPRIGDPRDERFILSRHSGRSGVESFLLRHLGAPAPTDVVDRVLSALKDRDLPPGLTEILSIAGIAGIKALSTLTVLEGPETSETTATFLDGSTTCATAKTPTESFLSLLREATGIPLTLKALSVTGHTGLPSPDVHRAPDPLIRVHGELVYPDGTSLELDRMDTTYARAAFSLLLDASNAYRARIAYPSAS